MLIVLLEQKEIICGGHCDDVLLRMPGSVQDLLVEVQTVNRDFVFLSLAARTHLKFEFQIIDYSVIKLLIVHSSITLRGLSMVFGLATSRDASNVTSLRVLRSNILKYQLQSQSLYYFILLIFSFYLKKLL